MVFSTLDKTSAQHIHAWPFGPATVMLSKYKSEYVNVLSKKLLQNKFRLLGSGSFEFYHSIYCVNRGRISHILKCEQKKIISFNILHGGRYCKIQSNQHNVQ